MKNRLKSIIAIVFAVMVGFNVFAYDFEVDGIYYNINYGNSTVSVTSGTNKYSGEIVIPSSVTYNEKTYSVTSIVEEAFKDCTELTSVTIENGVKTIKYAAFQNCTGLTSVTIPNSVTYIDLATFKDCKNLTTLNYNADSCDGNGFVPDDVAWQGYNWLSGCDNLETVNIGSNVKVIPPNFIYKKSKVTSVTIPNSVTSIGMYAFYSCTGLTSVTIENSVESIGSSVFEGCTALQKVTLGSKLQKVQTEAFKGCTALDTIVCKGEIASDVEENAFEGVDKNAVTLVVPCGKKVLYQSAVEWKWFNIVEDCEDSGIEAIAENSNIVSLYPNPANKVVTLDLGHLTLDGADAIIVINSKGQIVYKSNIQFQISNIDVSDWQSGVYYVKVGDVTKKLIVE